MSGGVICGGALKRLLSLSTDPPAHADLIFCFAGKKSRKLFALELFRQGYAPRLILSTGRFEIRRYNELPNVPPLDLLAAAAPIPPHLRHFFVVIEPARTQVYAVRNRALGTLTEVIALRGWLARRSEITSVIVISSASHLRRIRCCCRALIPNRVQMQFVACPSAQEGPSEVGDLLRELVKLCLYPPVVYGARFLHSWSDEHRNHEGA